MGKERRKKERASFSHIFSHLITSAKNDDDMQCLSLLGKQKKKIDNSISTWPFFFSMVSTMAAEASDLMGFPRTIWTIDRQCRFDR